LVRYLFYSSESLSKLWSIPGVYSGIFALHLQCHASRKESDDAKQKIVFYALCVLYVFSVAIITLDTGNFVVAAFVSNNAAFFSILR
jgi:hypothetical protein